ncbi:MAG: hypothetical protein ACRCUY_09825 [Thermoguttaceae bacterium]
MEAPQMQNMWQLENCKIINQLKFNIGDHYSTPERSCVFWWAIRFYHSGTPEFGPDTPPTNNRRLTPAARQNKTADSRRRLAKTSGTRQT